MRVGANPWEAFVGGVRLIVDVEESDDRGEGEDGGGRD